MATVARLIHKVTGRHRRAIEWAAPKIIDQVRPHSMVPDDSLKLTMSETIRIIDSGVEGDLAEFGTWMGGASFAMLLIQRALYGRIIKPVWMFDSFEGLPPADERDGAAAIRYQAEKDAPGYYDNCTAPIDKVRAAIASFGFSDKEAMIVQGWFDDTIPAKVAELEKRQVSLLRVDCDWYAPVKLVLDKVVPAVSEDGSIILDDYFSWDGCALATHAHLAESQSPLRIRSLPSLNVAWMVKQSKGRV